MDINKEDMTSAFKEALVSFHGEQTTDANRDFFIPREEHYEQHSFLKGFMEFVGITKKTVWRAVVALVIGGLAVVMVLGTVSFIFLKMQGFIQ